MLHRLKQRLLPDRVRPFDPTGVSMESFSLDEVEAELLRIMKAVLRRAGIDPACVTLTVERAGVGSGRRPVFRSMIEFTRWEPTTALHLLLGLAHIERAMRRSVAASWAAESCHFAGVWVHPSEAILESRNLRHLASMVAGRKEFSASGDSTWSASSAPQPAYEETVPSRLER